MACGVAKGPRHPSSRSSIINNCMQYPWVKLIVPDLTLPWLQMSTEDHILDCICSCASLVPIWPWGLSKQSQQADDVLCTKVCMAGGVLDD